MTTPAERVAEMYAAWGRGDLSAILDGIAPETDWGWSPEIAALPLSERVPYLRHSTTPAQVAEQYFGAVIASVDFHKFEPFSIVGDDTYAQAIINVDLTVRATGKRLAYVETHAFEFRDGLVVWYRNNVDSQLLAEVFTA